ncbi:hypothetical protein D3C79_1119520 [compost metagenome]
MEFIRALGKEDSRNWERFVHDLCEYMKVNTDWKVKVDTGTYLEDYLTIRW